MRPFSILARHFVVRLLDNDLVSPQADAHQGAALVLACLASASTFLAVLMGAKYVMTFYPMPKTIALNAIDDMFFFVSASMIVLALAAVVAWDALVLDDRDETILGPLPIPRGTIVRAKLASMGVLAGVVLVALNGTVSLLHPATVLAILPASLTGALRLIGAHAAATIGAGAFGFATVLAIRELARAVSGPWWPAVSTRLQGMLLATLVATFLLLPGWMSRVADRLVAPDGEVAATTLASPPMWFLGLHQALAGDLVVDVAPPRPLPRRLREEEARALTVYRAGQPASGPLASIGLFALTASCATALLAYLWNARRPAARPRTPTRRRTALEQLATRLACRTIATAPAARAGFFFTLQTLGRSPQHRAALAVGAAVGLSMAAITLGHVTRHGIDGLSRPLLAAQTLFIACLLVGAEHAMRLPAHLPSGWSVQLAWGGDPREYEAGVRRGLMVGIVLPALVVLFAVHLAFLDAGRALAHGVIGGLAAAVAIEARARVSHTLPFLTAYVSGGRIKLAPFWFGLVVVSAQVLGAIEAQALASVAGTLKLIVVLAAAAAGLAWLNGRGAPRGDELDAFTAPLDEATQLKL